MEVGGIIKNGHLFNVCVQLNSKYTYRIMTVVALGSVTFSGPAVEYNDRSAERSIVQWSSGLVYCKLSWTTY